ncbi:MAG: M48 family metalloprotease [Candidatus Aminicenantes bacterium]|nr:MAG: M48 family metalloprotease [Candidatus Aminicenantes bacterium]
MNKYFRITHVILIILTAVLLVQSGCAVNPVTGKKEIMLISESMEIQMGKEIDQGLRRQYGIYDDPQLNVYIDQIGQQMVPHCHRPHLQYHFAILDTPVENAFAAPGGYIYITRGLMAMINSEAELATIIGHELGHVNARHSARQMTRSILFTVGIVLASELSKDFRKIAPISMIATQLLFLKYSRSDEYQADSLGVEYSLKIGYSAHEMVTFFNNLQRLSQSKGGAHLPNFLSTHPLTPRRIDRVKELLQSEEYSQPGGLGQLKVERNGYINRLNGLVYGNNPKQGYVEGNAFYHPDMRFYFSIPSGWKVSNTPRQVTLSSPGGKAVILLQAESTSEALDSYTGKMMKQLSNPQILREGYRYINGMDAYHTLASMVTDTSGGEGETAQELNVQVSCIRKGGIIFTFFSAASQPDFSTYRYAIDRTVESFNRLTSPGHINRRPYRVAVRRIQYPRSLSDFLSRLGIPRQNWNQIALINGMELNHQLSANQLVKIIR